MQLIKIHKADILFIFVWCLALAACTKTVRAAYFQGNPPVWDNLSYQNEALTIVRHWLAGNNEAVWEDLFQSSNPLYAVFLGFSYLFLGIHPDSPYLISAFFGFLFLCVVYLLSLQLGASRDFAFGAVIFWSITPNFLYQNFLQTRNDYALACFLGLAWLFFLQAAKSAKIPVAFVAGLLAGLGVLLKASAPGYVIFGPLLFLIWPLPQPAIDFRSRCRLVLSFALGAALMCGWHYLPNLREHLAYYGAWANDATKWKIDQYGLRADWTDYLFYLKNLLNVHLGKWPQILLAAVLSYLAIWAIFTRLFKKNAGKSQQYPWIGITLIAAILPLVLLSWKQSYASVGDTPIIPLLISVAVAVLSKVSRGLIIPKNVLLPMAMAALFFMLPQMQVMEKKISAKDFEVFCTEIKTFRKKYFLKNSPMLQIFSHPIYNIDSYRWAELINGENLEQFPQWTKGLTQILLPEIPQLIASKLTMLPAIILSESPATIINGEKFHTFNRFHLQINHELKKLNLFVNIKNLNLENQRFPAYLALNRNLVQFFPEQETEDGWVEWGSAVNLFALEPSQLIWSGLPIRPIQKFLIKEKNGVVTVQFNLEKIDPEGVYTYRSGWVPGSAEPRVFMLRPLAGELVPAASQEDSRPLAFRKVQTAADRAGTDEKSGK